LDLLIIKSRILATLMPKRQRMVARKSDRFYRFYDSWIC